MGFVNDRAWSWIWSCVGILLFLGTPQILAATPFLVGTFFGVPGTNATFDYVVSGFAFLTRVRQRARKPMSRS